MKHKRRQQPVTRREVLRIVQAARDDIIHTIIFALEAPTETPERLSASEDADRVLVLAQGGTRR